MWPSRSVRVTTTSAVRSVAAARCRLRARRRPRSTPRARTRRSARSRSASCRAPCGPRPASPLVTRKQYAHAAAAGCERVRAGRRRRGAARPRGRRAPSRARASAARSRLATSGAGGGALVCAKRAHDLDRTFGPATVGLELRLLGPQEPDPRPPAPASRRRRTFARRARSRRVEIVAGTRDEREREQRRDRRRVARRDVLTGAVRARGAPPDSAPIRRAAERVDQRARVPSAWIWNRGGVPSTAASARAMYVSAADALPSRRCAAGRGRAHVALDRRHAA